MAIAPLTKATRTELTAVPSALIYEYTSAGPIYYRDYESVLAGSKKREEIMGSSYLQALIISRLLSLLFAQIGDRFEILTNEMGLQLAKGIWRAADIAIYPKERLQGIPLHANYLSIPPQIVIEVDTKADLQPYATELDYYYSKTDDLLDFGVERVLWIFTQSHKVMTATPHREWTVQDWVVDMTVLDELTVNVAALVEESA